MVLADRDILEYVKSNNMIEGFDDNRLEASSYDCIVTGEFVDIDGNILDLDSDGNFIIQPQQFVLTSTVEKVNIPPNIQCTVYGKSSIGRIGLEIHLAGLIDPGFSGNITLELVNHSDVPITIKKRDKICQLRFDEMKNVPNKLYNGHYQNQAGATKSVYSDGELSE